jgi:hypothetical protein
MKKFANCSDNKPKNHCDKKGWTFYPMDGRAANASLPSDRPIQRSAGDDSRENALTKGRSIAWSSSTRVHLVALLLLLLLPFVYVVSGTSAPALSYALTTTVDPAVPGQGIQFTATVTNLSSISQYVTLYYDVPQFTTGNGYPAGTGLSYGMGYVAAGGTQVVSLDFKVLSGTQAPPDGSLITAVVLDRSNGGLVSCSATVKSAPVAVLELATAQSPVTSGGSFSYSLAYHNGTASALANAQLSLPVPVGASFISATGGGVLGTDGVVRWTLSSVAAGARPGK